LKGGWLPLINGLFLKALSQNETVTVLLRKNRCQPNYKQFFNRFATLRSAKLTNWRAAKISNVMTSLNLSLGA